MSVKSVWRALRGGSGGDDLTAAVAELTGTVRELTAANRKQAEQIKKLRDGQNEADARWQAALERLQQSTESARLKEQREALKAGESAQRRWQGAIGALQDASKLEQKWRVIFSRQIDALMRHQLLSRLPIPSPFDLTARRFRLRSQNEEDGVLLALFERAGVTSRRFVEIGSGRSGGNAALLAYECGWSGVMIDIDPAVIELLTQRFAHNPGVVGVAAAVLPSTVNQLLRSHGFDGEVDLLSIDIDSYDYWILDALEATSPRVLVLEYNASFGPHRSVTIPRDQPLDGAPKSYRGASLAALDALASRKGYRLVVCEPAGANAFFLRDDVAPELARVPVAQAFRPAVSRLELGDTPLGEEPSLGTDPRFPLVEV